MLVVGWHGRNARVSDHRKRRHRRHRLPFLHIMVVLVSMP
jgi:hypothetical protein